MRAGFVEQQIPLLPRFPELVTLVSAACPLARLTVTERGRLRNGTYGSGDHPSTQQVLADK